MAVPSLGKIAEDIKTLDEAGLLDLESLNRHLWPVAVIRMVGSPAVLHTERGHRSSRADNANPSPPPDPTQPEVITRSNKPARVLAEDIRPGLAESAWKHESSTAQRGSPHHHTSKSHNDTITARENNKDNVDCVNSNGVASNERRSARLASLGDKLIGGLHPAVSTGSRGGKARKKGRRGINNTRVGDTVEYSSRKGHVLSEGGGVCKDQDSSEDQSSDDGTASERSGPPTAYPKSLMVQQPTWTYGRNEGGTKRINEDVELQSGNSKRRHTASAEKSSCSIYISMSSQDRANLPSETQEQTGNVDRLRNQFRSKWAGRLPTFDAWQNLDRFARIGTRPDQEAYEELEIIMQRALSIGTLKVQAAFAQSVTAWMASPHITKCAAEPPAHLETIPGFEAGPFQRFWKAMEMSRFAKGVEGMAILLRRKSLVDLMVAYKEVIKHVRASAGGGKLKLRSGETAGAKAREIMYSILYPEVETRTRMRSSFNYDQQCAQFLCEAGETFWQPRNPGHGPHQTERNGFPFDGCSLCGLYGCVGHNPS